MEITNPTDLLEHLLQDLYSAEIQLVDALPNMAKSATSSALSNAFDQHLEQTRIHVARLEEVAGILDAKLAGTQCKGMKGLIEEAEETISKIDKGQLLDIVLLSGARKVEHYEILGYTLVVKMLKDDKESADILSQTLSEEESTDKKLLNMIAE